MREVALVDGHIGGWSHWRMVALADGCIGRQSWRRLGGGSVCWMALAVQWLSLDGVGGAVAYSSCFTSKEKGKATDGCIGVRTRWQVVAFAG